MVMHFYPMEEGGNVLDKDLWVDAINLVHTPITEFRTERDGETFGISEVGRKGGKGGGGEG